jgi:hypothetical protein
VRRSGSDRDAQGARAHRHPMTPGWMLVFLLVPLPLCADDLGVLAYPLLFWPAGVVLCAAYIACAVYLFRAMTRGRRGWKTVAASAVMALIGIAGASLFPWIVMMNSLSKRSPNVAYMTVAPVIALGALCACAALAVIVKALLRR